MSNQIPIAISMGDPAGIGPEIITALFQDADVASACFVLGDETVLREAVRSAGAELEIAAADTLSTLALAPGRMSVLRTSRMPALPTMGHVSAAAGHAAYDAICEGISLAKDGRIAALVTAPIHKEALAAAGIAFPGHTEMLAHFSGVQRVGMMLANEALRVVLVTIHMSLLEAIKAADFEAQTRAIDLAHEGAQELGIVAPRIAVAGLNPHAGENGLFGREEREIIGPAIEAARARGLNVTGPHSGDTVFMQARKGRFDVVVAQYHDQGLIPVKYLGVEEGVNITLGLPFVRTSPDHGTAFDIAGQGIADPSSLRVALTYAKRMVAARATTLDSVNADKPAAPGLLGIV